MNPLDPFDSQREGPLWKRIYHRFIRLHGEPCEIAMGFALGIFVAFTPFMGFHTAIAVFLAAIFGWSKIAAAMAVWVTNPFTAPVVYGATYALGSWWIGGHHHAAVIEKVGGEGFWGCVKAVPDIVLPLMIGGLLLGLPLALVGYAVSLRLVNRFRKAKEKFHLGHMKKTGLPPSQDPPS